MRALHVAVVMTLAATGGTRVLAQAPGLRSVRDGVYTTAQADQGQAVYDDKCAVCHGTMATISPDMAPLLNDHTFGHVGRVVRTGPSFSIGEAAPTTFTPWASEPQTKGADHGGAYHVRWNRCAQEDDPAVLLTSSV